MADVNWGDLAGQLLGAGAPTIGSILGGLIPIPGGSIIGQTVGTMIAKAFGVDPKPEAVQQAMADATPEVAIEKIKLAEAEASARWPALAEMAKAKLDAETKQFQASLQDIQSARTQTVSLATAQSKIAWGAPAVSVIITLGYFLVLWSLMSGSAHIDAQIASVLTVLLGALTGALVQVCNYWLGSTVGSKNKDATLGDLAKQANAALLGVAAGKSKV